MATHQSPEEKAAADKAAADKAAAEKAAAEKAKAPADTKAVRVRAVRVGYYGLKRRQPGEEFELVLAKGQKLPSWVEPAK